MSASNDNNKKYAKPLNQTMDAEYMRRELENGRLPFRLVILRVLAFDLVLTSMASIDVPLPVISILSVLVALAVSTLFICMLTH